MEIQKLIVKDVRCFAGLQEVDIRRMTFLVGENSSGKSTALGCIKVISDILSKGSFQADFNAEPHQMGAFTDIARRGRPKTEEFQIGLTINFSNRKSVRFILTFNESKKGSEPAIRKFEIVQDEFSYEFIGRCQTNEDESLDKRFAINVKNIIEEEGVKRFVVEIPKTTFNHFGPLRIFQHLSFKELFFSSASSSANNQQFLEHLDRNFSLGEGLVAEFFLDAEILSFAPIRSSPQRTYNALKEEMSPDGIEIPNLLMNLSRTDSKNWHATKERILEFGKVSGLFTNMNVGYLGNSAGDPFQLQIKVRGLNVNLIDVGYGVNQILPMLVRIIHSKRRTAFLMQQPEVHLHPKAQAELVSLLCQLAIHEDKTFVIETHSDYMIDRMRIEIMNGNFNPEDVSLVYLEPKGSSSQVQVHNIAFDDQANMIGVPPGYRNFFMAETHRLLGMERA